MNMACRPGKARAGPANHQRTYTISKYYANPRTGLIDSDFRQFGNPPRESASPQAGINCKPEAFERRPKMFPKQSAVNMSPLTAGHKGHQPAKRMFSFHDGKWCNANENMKSVTPSVLLTWFKRRKFYAKSKLIQIGSDRRWGVTL